MLKTEIFEGHNVFSELEGNWRRLEAECEATVFQSWDWCDTWLSHYGRALEPFIVSVSKEQEICGLAPLVKSRSWMGIPIRRLISIGSGPSDYGGFLTNRADEGLVRALILAATDTDFDLIDLHQVDESTASVIKEALGKRLKISVFEQEPTFAVPMPESIDEYLPQLSKKFRKNVIYADRRLRRDFQYEERFYENESEIQEGMAFFFDLHQQRWRKKRLPGLFFGQKNRKFHLDLANKLASSGTLVLSLSFIDNQPAAAVYGFKYGQSYSYYLGGFDPALSKYSVSSVLIFNLMKKALSENAGVFDFLRGREKYKLRWRAQEKPLYRVVVNKSNWRGSMGAKLARKQNDFVQKARDRLHS